MNRGPKLRPERSGDGGLELGGKGPADCALDTAGQAPADEAFMRRALDLARQAARRGEVPVGAVLLAADRNMLAEAANAPIASADPTAHAEILALRAAGERAGNYRLPGTTLYVTLEPCAMCAGALVHARVSRIVYGAPDPKAGACGSVFDIVRGERLNHRIEVTAGVLADESVELLQEFFAARR